MSQTTRRDFFAKVGVGAAALGAASVLPAAAVAATTTTVAGSARPADVAPPTEPGSLVAYVDDVRTGKLTVMVGDQEVVVTDHRLVAALNGAVPADARA